MEAGEPGKAEDRSSLKTGAGGPSAEVARRRRMLRWGIVALAVVIAVIAWVATRGNGGGESEAESAPAGFEARIVDEAELREIAASAGHPVYWAGPMEGKELQADESKEGNVQVTYLDQGTQPSGEEKKALTIGSYPIADPSAALDGYAELKGAIVERAPDGRKLVSSTQVPNSVYFVSPDNSVQVEIYDPSAKRAMSLARSGKVQPVG